MNIRIEKLTGTDLLQNAMSHVFGIQVKASLGKWYKSEHSPVRTQLFAIYATDIPYSVAMQIRTHDKNGALMLVEPGRPDTGTDRGKQQVGNYRDALRNMFILCNAQHIMDWSRKRLCMKAEDKTRNFFFELRVAMQDIDPYLAEQMVPRCHYIGKCTEFKPCGVLEHMENGEWVE